jgi:hypothetical protein
MLAILHLLAMFVADLFKSRRRLEAENLFLRHQLNIALRRAPSRLRLHGSDRALLVWIASIWPNLLDLSQVVKPQTILRWHRSGFKTFWRWKSRHRAGRPKIDRELRDLIRQMSKENPLWGAPRIHGELLKLGFEVAESTVSKYMIKHRGPPSQTVADIPAQPCRRDRGCRSLPGSDPDVRVPVCLSGREPRSPTASLVRGNQASHGGVAGTADRRGISVGYGAALSDPRQ